MKSATLFCLLLVIGVSWKDAAAQSPAPPFVTFNDYVESTRAAIASDFVGRPDSKVRDAAAFEEMRQSILTSYEGIEVTHSFSLNGVYYDCVPIDQQPTLRNFGLTSIASPPPQEMLPGYNPRTGTSVTVTSTFDPDHPFDEYGNYVRCGVGMVPLLRTTLDTVVHFATLQDLYQKAPGGSPAEQSEEDAGGLLPPATFAHKYSYTYQRVDNWGGESYLNIWNPHVTTSKNEVFSLSQEWYVGGTGANTQTEEVGWIVYPAIFDNDQYTHFFIYSTDQNYEKGHGCYDNMCRDFIQVADFGILGARFSTISKPGGTQYDFAAEYRLVDGNWWVGAFGTWIGYYPAKKYHGGQNSRHAQVIEYGSESYASTVWPPEGSGQWSKTGFGHAAYQTDMRYWDVYGAGHWASLTAEQPSPHCYTITGPFSSNDPGWKRYFYEGGPGGTGC